MHRLQEVIRLHRLGRSCRGIARRLAMGRDTIRGYLAALAAASLLEGPPDDLPGLDTLAVLVDGLGASSSEAPPPRSSVARWRDEIARLRHKGAGPTAIHDHLRLHAPDYDGSLSAVKRLCLRLVREQGPAAVDVAIPVETAPGEVAQVDFGYAGKRYDPERGVLRKSWVFVMTLGYSRRTFCELVFDQKIETWIALHIAAFEHFGGVPAVIVPDNLKAAVVRAAFGIDDDPVIQRTYRELARHFGFQIDPAPPRAPQKKGKVEAGVRYVKGNFLTTWDSVDLPADRAALRRWLTEIADQRRHGTTGRRPIELVEEHERQALRPLPRARFELVVWKRARLHTDSHVQIDGAFYSAPWYLLHQELWVRCGEHSVAIYHQDRLLWTHARVSRGHRSTIDTHLPEHRRELRHRSREHWILRARRMGADVERLVERIFGADDVLTQLRRVQAVVTHLSAFPPERAQAAARRALHFGCLEYRAIKTILRQGLDLQPLPDPRDRHWAHGSRFARSPTESLFAHKEDLHVHPG
jgi:transposase/DNA-binding CsgD family transcriptional regulator